MTTVRIRFTKTGDAAYISLLDLQRVMQRAFKRSRLPVWYSLGFNPHIYMTFAAPLSLGQESLFEVVDVKCEQDDFDWSAAPEILNRCLPRGLVVQSAAPAKTDANDIAFAQYTIVYAPRHAQDAANAYAAYAKLPEAIAEKKGKRGTVKQLDLKQQVHLLTAEMTAFERISDGENDAGQAFSVNLLVPAGNNLNVNPILLLQFLEVQFGLPCTQGNILRTALLVPQSADTKAGKKVKPTEAKADLNALRIID